MTYSEILAGRATRKYKKRHVRLKQQKEWPTGSHYSTRLKDFMDFSVTRHGIGLVSGQLARAVGDISVAAIPQSLNCCKNMFGLKQNLRGKPNYK